MNHSNRSNEGKEKEPKTVQFDNGLFYHRRTKAMDMDTKSAAGSVSPNTHRGKATKKSRQRILKLKHSKNSPNSRNSNVGKESNLYHVHVPSKSKSISIDSSFSSTLSHSPISVDTRSPSASLSSNNSIDYSVDSFVSSTSSIDSLSRSKSSGTTTSAIDSRPIGLEFKADIPLSTTSIPCTAILSYQSPRTNKSILICMLQSGKSNRNKLFQYEPMGDFWKSMCRSRHKDGSRGFTILYPEHPEGMVIDSDREMLYLLDQGMAYNLRSRTWEQKCILPSFTDWGLSESSTLYIGGNVEEFHGLYHDRENYGLCHLVRDFEGNAVSGHCPIAPKFRFNGLQMIYCGWLQQLTVFGGRRQRVIRENLEWNYENMKYPGSFAIEQWDENQFSYHCNVGRHHRESSHSKLSKQKFSWKRSANKIGNLYHTEMRSVGVFDHIAIVFKYFGKDQYIEMRYWDLIFNKRQRSPYVLDFECGRFEDFCVLQMDDGDIRVFDRRTRHHVSVNAMHIMSDIFRSKTEVRYMSLVRGFCERRQSKKLGKHILKLIQNYLFVLAAHFPCGCHRCTQ